MPPADAPVSEQELRDHLAQLLPTHQATHQVPHRPAGDAAAPQHREITAQYIAPAGLGVLPANLDAC
jgi:hypothetical protein